MKVYGHGNLHLDHARSAASVRDGPRSCHRRWLLLRRSTPRGHGLALDARGSALRRQVDCPPQRASQPPFDQITDPQTVHRHRQGPIDQVEQQPPITM